MRFVARLSIVIFLLLGTALFAYQLDSSLAVPGGVLLFSSDDGDEFSGGALIRRGRRVVASGEMFSQGERFILLLPIPCDFEDPSASIELLARNGEVTELELTLRERSFVTEEIPLNRSMSSLRRSDDPRKVRESEHLWRVLSAFDPAVEPAGLPLLLPVGAARVSSRYGDRRIFRYADGAESRALHFGIDYAVPTGTPVRAPTAGRVVLAADRMTTGYTLVLEHGPGIYSLYYHLDSLSVEEGDQVIQGQIMAQSGSTGLSTGAHLHWELRINRIPVDPLLFLTRPFLAAK